MEGFEEVERVEGLETLTTPQRELLDGAIREHPELADKNLVVYRLKGGRAMVAPMTDAISLGDPLICVGGWTATYSMASSDRDVPSADVSVASAVADATRWLEAIE